jgi:hypothetical protein
LCLRQSKARLRIHIFFLQLAMRHICAKRVRESQLVCVKWCDINCHVVISRSKCFCVSFCPLGHTPSLQQQQPSVQIVAIDKGTGCLGASPPPHAPRRHRAGLTCGAASNAATKNSITARFIRYGSRHMSLQSSN